MTVHGETSRRRSSRPAAWHWSVARTPERSRHPSHRSANDALAARAYAGDTAYVVGRNVIASAMQCHNLGMGSSSGRESTAATHRAFGAVHPPGGSASVPLEISSRSWAMFDISA